MDSQKCATVLTMSHAEATGLPGTPGVGCVADVTYRPGCKETFSACVVASSAAIYILGPNKDERRSRERLTTRLLWQPSPQHMDPLMACVGDGEGVSNWDVAATTRIVALTAFLLHPAATTYTRGHASHASAEDSSTALFHHTPTTSQGGLHSPLRMDALAIVAAWSDAQEMHHVSLLMVPLIDALSPQTCPKLEVVCHEDVHRLGPKVCILRLFTHHEMTAQVVSGGNGSPMETRRSGNTSSESHSEVTSSHCTVLHRHIVLCSSYVSSTEVSREAESNWPERRQFQAYTGQLSHIAVRVMTPQSPAQIVPSTWLSNAHATLGEEQEPSGFPHRHNSACTGTNPADGLFIPAPLSSSRISVGLAEEQEVAPWLARWQTDHLVCAFAMQSSTSAVVAAAGTTSGRVILIAAEFERTVRRLAGPIADLAFVNNNPTSTEPWARCEAIDKLLEETSGQMNGDNHLTFSSVDSDDVSLVVLDSVGRVLVLRKINNDAPVTQCVADIPQVISLAVDRTVVHTPLEIARREVTGSRETGVGGFLDLSSLRHLLYNGESGTIQRGTGMPAFGAGAIHSSTFSAAAGIYTSSNDKLTSRAAVVDTSEVAGHMLSRGLLCLTHCVGMDGYAELVVSTMGNLLLSIQLVQNEDHYAISGFNVVPAPMHFVGFVDFFGSGCAELVMAGVDHVLVARRPRHHLKNRARVLLHLLHQHPVSRTPSNGLAAT